MSKDDDAVRQALDETAARGQTTPEQDAAARGDQPDPHSFGIIGQRLDLTVEPSALEELAQAAEARLMARPDLLATIEDNRAHPERRQPRPARPATVSAAATASGR